MLRVIFTPVLRPVFLICARSLRVRGLLVLLCASLLGGVVLASPMPQQGLRFIPAQTGDAIPDGVVTALAQDERGYIWAGGPTGLARFDGYRFQRLGLKAGAASAEKMGFVTAIVPAGHGHLWAGLVTVGLAYVDADSGHSVFYQHDAADPASLTSGVVRALAREEQGGLWVATSGGGVDYLPAGGSQFRHWRGSVAGLPSDWMFALLVDRQGDVWAGGRQGLVRKKRASQRFEAALPAGADQQALAQETVTMLFQDAAGVIWVGTQNGRLLLLDPQHGTVRWMAQDGSEAAGPVNTMIAADRQTVWVGRGNGIDVRDGASGALRERLTHRRDQPHTLPGADVRGLVRDASGVLFVGEFSGGVQRYVPPLPGIAVLVPDGGDPQADIGVRSVLQMANGEVWLGRSEGGVTILDSALRPSGHLALPRSRMAQAGASPVTAMAQSRSGQIWLGADYGLYQFDGTHRLLRSYDTGGGKVRRLLFEPDGALLIATQDGLLRLAAGASELQPVQLAQGGPLRGYVDALDLAPDGRIWVGGVDGMYWRDAAGTELHKLASYPDAQAARWSVKGLLYAGGAYWCETDNGLYRIDHIEGQRARYTLVIPVRAGSRRSIGANLLHDGQGRIWSHRGIYSPVSDRFYEFSPADGVDFGTGWFRSYTALKDGRMLFGGSAGLLLIDTTRYVPWAYQPPVVLTRVLAGGQAVVVPPAGVLQVGPQQRTLRVEFAALDYSYPEGLHYRYQLQGYDEDWRETDAALRVASYDQLPPGSYTLQVQGSNRNGVWSPYSASLKVLVLPLWWETWWARTGLVVLLVLALVALLQWRTGQLQRRKQMLELSVSERTAELQQVSAALEAKTVALELASRTDPLTGLHNRRFLTEQIDNDVAQSLRRYAEQERRGTQAGDDGDLIFFLIDIDHFKPVNDQYGHAAGDAVLQQMRARLLSTFRDSDYLIRWGGEEFLVVARATRRSRAPELAERARLAVAQQPFLLPDGTALGKTCSIGYACFPLSTAQPQAVGWPVLIEMADAALYHVKHHGRDGWCGVSTVQESDADRLHEIVRQELRQLQALPEVELHCSSVHLAVQAEAQV
ncbi:diguanylate cyclase [Pseudoduganella sp. FT93W]|uniref:diguanylate cyclase n=1 Tax=Duganella fentianensis TaxID=2692177 RepID=A0A845HX98_9BURK|nr:ligand-binding sensor domain-containing diguanylate cyclase [Duganella fentianensis]MYN45623.1 diguanylate cyclase [Duganella fentianensis]